MYCKYCGQEVTGRPQFCPHCGREITKRSAGEAAKEAGGSKTPFYLMLAIPVLPLLLSFLPVQGMLLINWFNVMRSVITSAIGIAGLLYLCQSGRIDPSRFYARDVLMWLLWIYLPILTSSLTIRIYYAAAGQYVLLAYTLLQNVEMLLGQLFGLWVWVELAVLGLVRSGSLKVTAKKAAFTLGALAVWSYLIYLLRAPILHATAGGMEEIMSLLLAGSALYFPMIWLRRGFELAFMVLHGGDRLASRFGIVVPVILNILLILFTPVTVFTLGYGIQGMGISTTGAYLFSALSLVLLRAKKERGEAEG